MVELAHITDSTFEDFLKQQQPVLVEFWASWCPPCKMMEPMLRELAGACEGRVRIATMNVDQNKRTASHYAVNGVPTFILFAGTSELTRLVGAQTRRQLEQLLATAGGGRSGDAFGKE